MMNDLFRIMPITHHAYVIKEEKFFFIQMEGFWLVKILKQVHTCMMGTVMHIARNNIFNKKQHCKKRNNFFQVATYNQL